MEEGLGGGKLGLGKHDVMKGLRNRVWDMNRQVTENMWISDYNDELTEYMVNVRLYGVL
jgi:hypothetical protein